MSRATTTVLAVVVLALAGAAAWALWPSGGAAGPAAARTVEARSGPIRQVVREVGRLQPVVRLDVKPEISGRVAQILAGTGQRVKAGEVLVRLDDRVLSKQLEQARIKVEQARLNEDKQRRNLDRRTQLSQEGRGLISPEELELARTDFDLAVVARRDAEYAVQGMEEQIQHTAIPSPIDGQVIEVLVNPGDVVIGSASAGQPTSLLTVAHVERMLVVVEVNEMDYPKVRSGLPAEVRASALPDRVFLGKVVAVGLAGHPDPKNKDLITYTVQTEVADPDGSLRAGMTASVDVITQEKAEALLLPREAVRREDGKAYVVRGADGSEARLEVELGLENETEVEILSGLAPGDLVKVGAWTEEDWLDFREEQTGRREESRDRRRKRGGHF